MTSLWCLKLFCDLVKENLPVIGELGKSTQKKFIGNIFIPASTNTLMRL